MKKNNEDKRAKYWGLMVATNTPAAGAVCSHEDTSACLL